MPSVQILDFRRGIDRRRPRVAGQPGTLWIGKNCHISRGGDIEGVKDFAARYALPGNTFGMDEVNGQLYTFGSANNASSMPNGVQYQRLTMTAGAMARVIQSVKFNGAFYVIIEDTAGGINHYYDGTRVSEWDALADAASDENTLAEYIALKLNVDAAVDAISFGAEILVTAVTPGTAFTLTSGATGTGTLTTSSVQANVAEVAEVRATGTVTITGGTSDPGVNYVNQITVDGEELMAVPIDWFSSHSATANAITVEINNNTSTHGYSASAVGAIITIQAAPGTGATPNGFVVATDEQGDVTVTDVNMANGVTYVAPVAQVSKLTIGGVYAATDVYTATLNSVGYKATGRASAHGSSAFVYKGRVYSTARSLIRYCKLNDPTDWTDATASTGAGFINVSNDSQGDLRLVGMAVYQKSVAVFARKAIKIYSLSADAADNVFEQAIDNAGAVALRSIIPYFNTDILYLDQPGIRSVRVRDVDANPYVDTPGDQLDPFIQEWNSSVTESAVQRAVGIIEPLDGRYLLAIDERVFVLSTFPKSKIEAWTYYEPGFVVTDFVRVDTRLYARDENTIYLYGGTSGAEYPDDDAQDIEVSLPFISPKNPAEFKEWTGFDAACVGTWRVQALVDSNDESKLIEIGRIVDTTYNHGGIGAVGESTLFALKLTCTTGGATSISSLEMHYEAGDSEA